MRLQRGCGMQGALSRRRLVARCRSWKRPWHLSCMVAAEGDPMDLLFVAATVAFFALSLAYLRGCDGL